jgi:hypothetical protein
MNSKNITNNSIRTCADCIKKCVKPIPNKSQIVRSYKSFDELDTSPYEENAKLQYHIEHNIKIVQHRISHININPKSSAIDFAELEDLYATLHIENAKLKQLKSEPHDWFDPLFYREYDC